MTIHVNLAIALLLLNLHFLPNTPMGIWKFSWPSPWFCFYLAIALLFSLLTSFCWMAVEGFHLYLLLVKVFNIYVKHYLLKVSIVGWGVPVVFVSIVAIVNRDVYGSVSMDQTNSTVICFIRDDVVKEVTVMGLFGLVFLFNLSLLTVTVRNMLRMRKSNQFGPSEYDRTKKNICTLLGVITLLGTTWGLIFFCFGKLTTVGLYAFSILNPLQDVCSSSCETECILYPCTNDTIKTLMLSLDKDTEGLMELCYIRSACSVLFSQYSDLKKLYLGKERKMIHNVMESSGENFTSHNLKQMGINVMKISEDELNTTDPRMDIIGASD
ncbi:adhesion G-protein coupled receptor G1-like [Eucyclogobius newberryi]|uniref:adhesion G-protein coupled receptor G1-like n=1 Tax=Eucyclogobius newberryi TaxID=166745 RepID=UPI003B5BC8D6